MLIIKSHIYFKGVCWHFIDLKSKLTLLFHLDSSHERDLGISCSVRRYFSRAFHSSTLAAGNSTIELL